MRGRIAVRWRRGKGRLWGAKREIEKMYEEEAKQESEREATEKVSGDTGGKKKAVETV
jgi:hypothetical protein